MQTYNFATQTQYQYQTQISSPKVFPETQSPIITFPTKDKNLNNPKFKEPAKSGHVSTIPVQPIVGEDIDKVKEYILNRPQRYKVPNLHNNTLTYNLRDYTLFCFNINIGLRISDFLSLKISDILVNGKIRDYLPFREGKNKKLREMPILPEVKAILMEYINALGDYKSDWYLFFNIHNFTPYAPLRRETVWKQMDRLEKDLEFNVPLGSHSLRKTFVRAIFDRLSPTDPMALLVIQDMLGHSSPKTTVAYMGITREKGTSLRIQCGPI